MEKILVIDNFSSGSRENLKDSIKDERLAILDMDITDNSVTNRSGDGFDLVLHLAAVANPKDYERHPVETLMVNSHGSENMIAIAERNKAKYIFFSSSEVYGNHNPIPNDSLGETAQSRIILNQRRSPYVVGKCFGEEMTINLCRNKGLDHLIIRPFNIYGPNMDLMTNYGRVIPNFCVWGLRGDPLKIHGDGTQIRSFCFIDDLIEAFISLLNEDVVGKSINIGYPHPTSILDLGRMVSEILNIEEKFQHVERYPYEPYMRVPDITLMKKLTGWEPRIYLRSGLERTIEWFREIGIEKYVRI
jgi:nucleoside-diphosphate-sugar epimerase